MEANKKASLPLIRAHQRALIGWLVLVDSWLVTMPTYFASLPTVADGRDDV